jgi:hypothetical protein
MACTLPCSDQDLARVAAGKPPSQAHAAAPAPAVPARQPQAASKGGGNLRAPKGKRLGGGAKGARSAAAVAAPVSAGQAASSTLEVEFATGLDVAVIKGCDGWKNGHNASCQCKLCVIPPGTVVRRLIQPGFNRESEYLNQHWKGISRGRFPFCAMHCNMRITEARFLQHLPKRARCRRPRSSPAQQRHGVDWSQVQKVSESPNVQL